MEIEINREKNDFDRQEALKICLEYYQAKGYSEKHCISCSDCLSDSELNYICQIIIEEQKNEKR